MRILKMLFVLLYLVLLGNSDLIAQNKTVNTVTFEQKTKWLAKNITKAGYLTYQSRSGTSQSRISRVKFDGCQVIIEMTSIFYPKPVTQVTELFSTESSDFRKNETYQVDALKQHKSVNTTLFNLVDLDPEQIKVNWSPNKKLIGGNNKLVALVLPTHNEDKAVEYKAGKFPMFFTQVQLLVNRKSAEKFSRFFKDVIEKCQ